MRGVFKRGTVWYIRYTAPGGKRKWEAVGPSKRKAELALAKRKTQIREGKFFDDGEGARWAYSQLLDRYREYSMVAKKPSTARNEQYIVEQLRTVFGSCLLKDFTPQRVMSYLEGMLASGKSPSTASYHLSILKPESTDKHYPNCK